MIGSVTEVPFNRFIGIESADDAADGVRLPAGPHYLNHVGTVHASAQLALAEAASGEWLLRQLDGIGDILAVVRRVQAKFRQPARGGLSASARIARGDGDSIVAELDRRGRALVAVNVDLHDESGAHTLTAEVEWFLQRAEQAGASS